jgi:hypothetical protein
MNITSSIIKTIGIEILISENPAIQFYASGTADIYQWRYKI